MVRRKARRRSEMGSASVTISGHHPYFSRHTQVSCGDGNIAGESRRGRLHYKTRKQGHRRRKQAETPAPQDRKTRALPATAACTTKSGRTFLLPIHAFTLTGTGRPFNIQRSYLEE
jgi:hypothetical protein